MGNKDGIKLFTDAEEEKPSFRVSSSSWESIQRYQPSILFHSSQRERIDSHWNKRREWIDSTRDIVLNQLC